MHNNRTIWIALGVGLLALCFCCLLPLGFLAIRGLVSNSWLSIGGQREMSETLTRSANVSGPSVLAVDVPVGNVNLRTGPGSQVMVEATKRAWGNSPSAAQVLLDRIQVDVQASGNQVRVQVIGLTRPGQGQSPRVDLTITAPAETSVNINSRVGNITVDGTQGDLQVRADVGEVQITGVRPVRSLSVQSRVSNLQFDGPIVPNASYELISDIGRILVRAPASSGFHLDARSDIGTVRSGFTVSGRGAQGVIGKELQGDVGNAPTASLTLRSRVGDITVEPR